MSEIDAVLFANEAFYTAFQTGDLAQMRQVWAEHRTISCIHPGWQPLIGQDEVMESWRAILESGETAAIRCEQARAHLMGDAAYVTAYERLPRGILAATNLFIRQGALWRMVHHQAGPCQDAPPPEPDDDDPTLQ